MKIMLKLTGIVCLAVLMGFSMAACPAPSGGGGGVGGVPDLPGTITITYEDPYVDSVLTAVYSGGTEGLAYQWKKGGANVGTNSATYMPDDEGEYAVTVSKAKYKSKDSDPVTVIYDPARPPLPGTITIIEHEDGPYVGKALSAVYSGDESVDYQWKKDGAAVVDANSDTYTPDEPGLHTVTVSAQGYRPATSAALNIRLRTLSGEITIEYSDRFVGQKLSAVYSGEEGVTYQWKDKFDNVVETGAAYTPDEEGLYTVTVSLFGYESKTSDPLRVVYDPDLGDLSGYILIEDNGLFVGNTLNAVYGGFENVAYQWKRDGAAVGTNSDRHTPQSPGLYTVTVHADGYNPKTSAGVTVALKTLSGTITITEHEDGPYVRKEMSAVYSGGENVSYQWQLDGANVGANPDRHTPFAEGSYTVTVSLFGYESKTSDPLDIIINPSPQPFKITFEGGDPIERPAVSSAGYSYKVIDGIEVISVPWMPVVNYSGDCWRFDIDFAGQDLSAYTGVDVVIGHPDFKGISGYKVYFGHLLSLYGNNKEMGMSAEGTSWGVFYVHDGYTETVGSPVEIPFCKKVPPDGAHGTDPAAMTAVDSLRIEIKKIETRGSNPGSPWERSSGDIYELKSGELYIESIRFNRHVD
jgi:hypothetical protein